eukprot:CAMPEP_0203756396 /NCGR_PEP_ID=MMETSP0098-20131031/9700_1 /ASSEMBLY_ACC=CAM_ASM_000208 /TAXON_ID=96639 /ORGANISM=" , Strain NY0313808BC1" /LENGTH=342 /DNA_ID=CAMNT_0050648273 /DNA_START=43 /DNA_END=1071 /DNA_ORIENTATION=+
MQHNTNAHTRFACNDCQQVFESCRALRIHVAQHKWGPHRVIDQPQGQTFQCLFQDCGKIVKDRKVLRKHLLTHRPREFECSFEGCHKRFYERAKLKRHFLVHTGEKEFTCTFPGCNKKFAYKANLKTHVRTHTGHRPFACTFPDCDKTFAQASNRNSHVLTHTQTKRKRTKCKLDLEQNDMQSNQTAPLQKSRRLGDSYPSDDSTLSMVSSQASIGTNDESSEKKPSMIHPCSPRIEPSGEMSISPSNRDTINSLLSLRSVPPSFTMKAGAQLDPQIFSMVPNAGLQLPFLGNIGLLPQLQSSLLLQNMLQQQQQQQQPVSLNSLKDMWQYLLPPPSGPNMT